MKKLLLIGLSIFIIGAMINLVSAQDKPAEPVKKEIKAKKEAPKAKAKKAKETKATGNVIKVEAESLTIKSGGKELVLMASADQLKGISVDQKVQVSYEKMEDGKLMLKTFKVLPAKKEVKKETKKEEKKDIKKTEVNKETKETKEAK